jgi:PKD repeat protein
MKKLLALLLVITIVNQGFAVLMPTTEAQAPVGFTPEVVCVPFHGKWLGVPHDTWIGKEIVLKGTAHDPDGDATLMAYKWDFGDGHSTDWIAGVNPYTMEAKHTYNGAMADGTPYGPGRFFTAWLYVEDNDSNIGRDSYFIAIRDISDPKKKLGFEVNIAIDNGLWWLHKSQYRYSSGGADYGYWRDSSYGSYYAGPTSTAVLAFEIHGHTPTGDKSEDPYVDTVQRGLNYVFTQCYSRSISGPNPSCPYGNPDANGNGIGIDVNSGRRVYEIGMVMMAIAASGDPELKATTGPTDVVGCTYFDILTDMVDMCAWGQNEAGSGRGGWRYDWNYGDSDNSVTQWPIIGLEAAKANWGIEAPDFVESELDRWLAYSQNANGGFGYTSPSEWVNPAKTGAGLCGLAYIDLPPTDARVAKAINYLKSMWGTSGTDGYWGNYYALYAIMKGCKLFHPEIENIGSHNWYWDDPSGFARYLINQQMSDGKWPAGSYGGDVLDTGWAILTLTPTITFGPPVADAGPDVGNHPPEPVAVKFDASGSYHTDPTRKIVLYEWDFESDGTWDYSDTDFRVEHAYPAYKKPDDYIDWDKTAKDYTATLRVKDDSDPPRQDIDTCMIQITPPPWKPVADPDGPYTGYVSVPVKLDGSKSYDPESKMYPPGHPWYETLAKYDWDLDNDGQFDDSSEIKPSFAWDNKGTYSVGLKVTDSQPSGLGGTTGPLDTDMKYTTVVIAEAQPRVITVIIIELRAIDTMDPIGSLSASDFYAKVSIDGVTLADSAVWSNDNDIYPKWSFSRSVSKTSVPIHVEIWDSDWPLTDDHVDIDKDSNDRDIDILFDSTIQSISGDVTFGYSQGGEGDGNRAEIWFHVGLDNGDKDGDGLFDGWETNGIHMNDDGVVDLALPSLGANPDHKDLFIEIDWMEDSAHSHTPMLGVSDAVIAAFANAPIANPDGTTGINLHIDESNGVLHQNDLAVWAGFDAVKATNFAQDRRFVYHYCLFIHNIQWMDGTSGIAEFPGNDFIVALGSWSGGIGTFQQQAGTLMHEFGHNLNLNHGGGDGINYKPNYLSIMSYTFQTTGIPPTWRLDYSRNALPMLDENNLDETVGIQDGTDNTVFYDTNGNDVSVAGTGAIDWNRDDVYQRNIRADINNGPDPGYKGPSKYAVLTGYNDWANILYSALGTSDFEDGVHVTPESIIELDIQTYYKMVDDVPPTTTMLIGDPKYVSDRTCVTLDTPFTLEATDDISGVNRTAFKIDDETWTNYSTPFNLAGHSDSQHTIYYFSSDNAGNMEKTKSTTVILDNTPPTTIDDYDGRWHNIDFTINLRATDNLSGVAETYYKINDGPTKNVSANGQPRIITESANNRLEYWSVDEIGNMKTQHKILTGIKLDKTSPTGSIIINNNATYANSTLVTLTLAATDATSGVYQVRFSNDGIWDTEPWEAYNTSKPWNLTTGDGNKTVYVQFVDNAGSISSAYLDIITLDTAKPTANAGADQTIYVGTAVNFDAGSSTDNMGIVSYEWSFGDETTGTGKTTIHTYASTGTYTVTLTVRDAAGNTGTNQAKITVSPQPTPLWIIGIVAAMIFLGIATTATVIWKKRK